MLTKLITGLLCAVASMAAAADPGYYVVTPYSQPGKAAVDLRYWSVYTPGRSTVMWPEMGLRYGINSRWTTELLLSFEGDRLTQQSLSSWNWQNTLLLTQGQYDFDLGLHVQAIHSPDDGNGLELGPIFQTELGHWQLNGNLIFERSLSDSSASTNLKYQWQALYRMAPGWRAGVVGFGELGPWNHWSDRASHRAGPTLRVGLGGVDLQAGYLWGKVFGRKAEMFTADLVWGF
ncbi:MAG: hypothetical protein JO006_20705 [Paucibacter sp.]|nr:hypothetical protein [Roseateles sp.]